VKARTAANRRKAGTIAWNVLAIASLVLIGYGIARANWHIWLPSPADREEVWIGSRFIFAGCALSLAAGVWSHLRGNPVWVSICVGLPGVLVGWATMSSPYDLKRHLAAVVSFPLALGGIAEVFWVRGHRQRE
jgi:hypothetical protein